MRRMALALATIGVMALGMAGTAAQAHDYGRGYHVAHQQVSHGQQWRGHHDWRAAGFDRRPLPRIIFQLLHR